MKICGTVKFQFAFTDSECRVKMIADVNFRAKSVFDLPFARNIIKVIVSCRKKEKYVWKECT